VPLITQTWQHQNRPNFPKHKNFIFIALLPYLKTQETKKENVTEYGHDEVRSNKVFVTWFWTSENLGWCFGGIAFNSGEILRKN